MSYRVTNEQIKPIIELTRTTTRLLDIKKYQEMAFKFDRQNIEKVAFKFDRQDIEKMTFKFDRQGHRKFFNFDFFDPGSKKFLYHSWIVLEKLL